MLALSKMAAPLRRSLPARASTLRASSSASSHGQRRPSEYDARRFSSEVAPSSGPAPAFSAKLRLLPSSPIEGSLEQIMTDFEDYEEYERGRSHARNGFEVYKGAANWEGVVGVRLDDLFGEATPETVLGCSVGWGSRFASWWYSTPKDGSVYMPGLPDFDLLAVYDEIVDVKILAYGVSAMPDPLDLDWKAHSVETDCQWDQAGLWVLTPDELRARGHFPRLFAWYGDDESALDAAALDARAWDYLRDLRIIVDLLGLDDQDARRRHLLRHHAAWDHAVNGKCLDELRDCGGFVNIPGFADAEPQQLIEELRVRKSSGEEPEAPEVPEVPEVSEVPDGADEYYKHLDGLRDSSELVVLRADLGDGRKLHSCVAYPSVESRNRVVVMLRDAAGEAMALGEFDVSTSHWSSIREAQGPATEETRAALTGYTAAIQAWRAPSKQADTDAEEDEDDDDDDEEEIFPGLPRRE
ncbi:hypothetical protein M885DRAFT_614804 [Pelagophyceae sp. CCMP2097]|nr:hypothetical protein M885DRAFT_614804 [Pelagophyceae sp. CCMP2097]